MDNLSALQSLQNVGIDYYFSGTGNYLIHEAVKAGAIKILNYLASKGADLNAVSKDEETALTLGAELGRHDALCIILQQGRGKVDINYPNRLGFTALQIAVKKGHKDLVSLLVEQGADIEVTTALGDSLLRMAQRAGHQEIVMLLVNAGASLR